MSDDLDSILAALRKDFHGTGKNQKATKKVVSGSDRAPQHRDPVRRTVAKSNGSQPQHRKAVPAAQQPELRGIQATVAANRSARCPPPIDPNSAPSNEAGARAQKRRALEPPEPTPSTKQEPNLAHTAPAPQAGDKAKVRPAAFVPTDRTPNDWPKKHEPGALTPGDSVWYRDERFWVVDAPKDWLATSYIRIADHFVRPGLMPDKDVTFCVHADMLELAPVRRSALVAQPTKNALETEQRKKQAGITDIGDEIGELLRGKSLDEVYKIAGQRLRVPVPELLAKYQKLNHGQQRMTLGNRLRAQLKKVGK